MTAMTAVLIPMLLSGGFALLGYWMGFRAGSRTPDRCRSARRQRQETRP